MRMEQCYLRIALRVRSASGLLDALGLGYDLPVGQAVYAIDAFPDDDLLWRIEWIGGVGYNTSEPEHHATVHVDDDGQRWPLDRLAVLFIDHDDVHGAYGRSGRRLADSQRRGSVL